MAEPEIKSAAVLKAQPLEEPLPGAARDPLALLSTLSEPEVFCFRVATAAFARSHALLPGDVVTVRRDMPPTEGALVIVFKERARRFELCCVFTGTPVEELPAARQHRLGTPGERLFGVVTGMLRRLPRTGAARAALSPKWPRQPKSAKMSAKMPAKMSGKTLP